MSEVYFITGANRGLGIEFVKQLSADSSNTVLACSRDLKSDANSDLQSLSKSSSGKIHILECDISNLESVASAKKQVESILGTEGKIDYLLNNAGVNISPDQLSLSSTPSALMENFSINVIGTAKVVETLAPLLKHGSVVMNMSSGLGSVGKTIDPIGSKCTPYAISKGALNMLTVHQSFALKEQGVRVVVMDPGWVKTRMGGEGAVLEPEESIKGMLKTIHGLKEGETAKFFQYDGEEIPW